MHNLVALELSDKKRIRSSPITGAGLAYLSKLTKLKYLGLDGATMTDESIQQIRCHTGLRSLNLGDSQLIDDGSPN
jgi:hypothetical protein